MSVWAVPELALAAAAHCDEASLVRDARAVLSNHLDVDLGAVAPGSPAQVGFQHLKTADALLAAQAIAHDDFDSAAWQFRHIISHHRNDGSVPLIIYGPSVDASQRWIDSDNTFFPGPAFWLNASEADTGSNALSGSTDTRADAEQGANKSRSRVPTSSLLAPPIAADVALQMYRLSPYESNMGVVGHTAEAVEFLCDVYPMLRKLHHHTFETRQTFGNSTLLVAQHPWETFSPFSRHWRSALEQIKDRPDYRKVISEIPASASARFAKGAILEGSDTRAVRDFYEPMMYLASCFNSSSSAKNNDPTACALVVHDVEYNSLVLRSADAFVDITRILVSRSSECPTFNFEVADLLREVEIAKGQAASLRGAIAGDEATPSQLWNVTTEIFNDDASNNWTRDRIPSLRGVIPTYAIHVHEQQMLGILSHFLPSSDTFQFLCAKHPTAFFPCGSVPVGNQVTSLHYNYFLQRGFAMNEFSGLSMYMRNMTRDLICTSNNRSAIALAYNSNSGQSIEAFEDSFQGSSLGAALLINILLPSVTPPPTPDALPVDHRMLTVIMCVELVVAFGVALGCVFLSVYFVANRPRDKRAPRVPSERRKRETRSNRSENASVFSSGNESQSSLWSSAELEEGLLSEEEDQAYGSFNNRRGATPHGAQNDGSSWQAVREALASISPW